MRDLPQIAQIEIPPRHEFIAPVGHFIAKYAAEMGVAQEKRQGLLLAVEQGILLIQKNNKATDPVKQIGVLLKYKSDSLTIEIINRGVPLYLKEEDPDVAKFNVLARALDQVDIQNRGREGQTVLLSLHVPPINARVGLEETLVSKGALDLNLDPIFIRELKAGEEKELSQLFYRVYEYRYIHDFVYYPEKIRNLIDERKLISLVAVNANHQLLGHIGLLKWGDSPPVYEPCLGVVDPRIKSRGVFGMIFQRMIDFSKTQTIQYLFFDFVTNHDYSQRFVAKYGTCDMALLVGCQSKETQARLEKLGMGVDSKEMDRYSLLFGLIPQVQYPFGKEIQLPNNIGEMLGFLLEPLNLSWDPAPRFQLLKSVGNYKTSIQPAQNAVLFDFYEPGRSGLKEILQDWRQFLRSGYRYCGIDVPIEAPGLGNLYDVLSDHGFFVGGFMPYHYSDRLGFRFQSIGPTKVAFDDIKVHTENSKRLLEIVRKNYERNGIV